MTSAAEMPLLAVDAGNSRVKWGLHDGAGWRAQGVLPLERAPELQAAWAALPAPARAVISNVAGTAAAAHIAAALPLPPEARLWITSSRGECGVTNGYARPEQLGSDRWAALVAARAAAAGPLLVVNAGTALTADALSAGGEFVGGIIVPGLDLMRSALAARLPGLDVAGGERRKFPASTADGVATGSVQALAGAVERMAAELARHGVPRAAPRCVLSGGNAAWLAPELNLDVLIVDNLVLEGLLAIATARAAARA